jgi:hypothetical protein
MKWTILIALAVLCLGAIARADDCDDTDEQQQRIDDLQSQLDDAKADRDQAHAEHDQAYWDQWFQNWNEQHGHFRKGYEPKHGKGH